MRGALYSWTRCLAQALLIFLFNAVSKNEVHGTYDHGGYIGGAGADSAQEGLGKQQAHNGAYQANDSPDPNDTNLAGVI